MFQGEDKLKIYDALLFNAAFLLIIWTLWMVEFAEPGLRLSQYGTRPRTIEGLLGIITTPFLHGSFDHIKNNSLSFLTLSTFLIFFYRSIAFPVIGWLYAVSGILLWAIAGGGNHIGASGVIYGLAAFIFVSGVIRRNPKLLRVSLVVAFLYGSIVWWVLPIDPYISWEGHLAGALVGTVLAVIYRKSGPAAPKYRWEEEEEWENLEEGERGEEPEEVDEPPREIKKPDPSQGGSIWQSDSTAGGPFRF